MDLSGEHLIPAPRERVWQALNDIDVLRACIPGCEAVLRISEQDLSVRVMVRVGAIKAPFSGRVVLVDLDPPASYTISGQGQGGAAGFAKGAAQVTLSPHGVDTLLTYKARVDVGGKLASVGNRVLQGVAVKTAEDFFTRFDTLMAGAAVPGGGVVQIVIPEGRSAEAEAAAPPRDAAAPLPIGGQANVAPVIVASSSPVDQEFGSSAARSEPWPTTRTVVTAGGVVFYGIILLALFW